MGLLLLVLGARSGASHQNAIEQLTQARDLVDVLYPSRCVELARRNYAQEHRRLIDYVEMRPGRTALAPDVELRGFVECRRPVGDYSLDDLSDLLDGLPRRDGHHAIEISLRHAVGPEDFALVPGVDPVELTVLPTLPGETVRRLVEGRDSFEVSVLFRDAPGSTTGLIRVIPGSIAHSTYAESPLEWAAGESAGFAQLSTGSGDETIVLPALQPFWEEIRSLPTPDAVRYLRSQAAQEATTVEMLGLQISAATLGWFGPLVLVLLAAYMLVHLRHLVRVSEGNPPSWDEHAWLGLFEDPIAVAATGLSMVLPVAGGVAISVRLSGTLPVLTVWSVLATLALVGIVGANLGILARLRNRGARL